jgi:diaminohydroxyphosphoribosylaminopyrimidine deaminase/5-amino-6-(5-phosphoribosylamino)uracil reductase
VGGETARQDDPRLTVRLPGRPGKQPPWRIVWARSGKLPRSLHLFSDRYRRRTLVFRNRPLWDVLAELGRREISHLLIEGGGKVLTEAFRAGVVNEVAFFVAPAVMGTVPRALQKLKAPVRLRHVRYAQLGPDLLAHGLLRTGEPAATSALPSPRFS